MRAVEAARARIMPCCNLQVQVKISGVAVISGDGLHHKARERKPMRTIENQISIHRLSIVEVRFFASQSRSHIVLSTLTGVEFFKLFDAAEGDTV